MNILIIIALFLGIIFYLNKKSKNEHFFKSEKELKSDLDLCIKILINFNFKSDYIIRFRNAYAHFIVNPEEYNGTSVINDRETIKGLELQSVVHDYDWILAKSFKDLHVSNIRYAKALRQVNVNFIWAWGLFVGLEIASIFKSIKY
jgi:hypothetical protein